MSFVFKSTNLNFKEAFMKAGNSVIAVNASGVRDNSSVTRSGFSMIELVFVIVILGVLAAVAVPRFVATRTDAQVATARSDLASVQKAIVAKVFADNIDATASQPTDPNKPWGQGSTMENWGKWIMEVGGLDGSRWNSPQSGSLPASRAAISVDGKDTIQPVGNVRKNGKLSKGGCGAVLGIAQGYMVFAPNNSGVDNGGDNGQNQFVANGFCSQLRTSYQSSGGPGNKVIPLASSGTVEF